MIRSLAVAACVMVLLSALASWALAQEPSPTTPSGVMSSLQGTWADVVEHQSQWITVLWWELLPLVLFNLVFLFFLEIVGWHPSRSIRAAYAFFILSSYAIYHIVFRPAIESYRLWIVWGVLAIAVIGLLLMVPRSNWQRTWLTERG